MLTICLLVIDVLAICLLVYVIRERRRRKPFIGHYVTFTSGPMEGQRLKIKDQTADELVFSGGAILHALGAQQKRNSATVRNKGETK